MNKSRTKKWAEISLLLIVLGSCVKFVYHLYFVLLKIEVTKGVITNIEFNIYKIKMITTIDSYDIHILPMYTISVLLMIHLIEIVIYYFRKSFNKDEEKKQKNSHDI